MKVAVVTREGFRVEDRPIPTCADDQVLVRTIACGICEGDIFHYRTRRELESREIVLGHEGTGVIVAVGPGVEEFAEGDLVTAMGGAFAEYFLATPDVLVSLPENLNPAHALGEPIACCVHASHRFGVQPGDRVAMVGCGFMGLTCMQLAKLQGAGFICALEPIPWRRETALELGADVALSPDEHDTQQVLREFGEFDVVIEAAGVQTAIDISGDLVSQHGRIVLVGYHQSNGGMRRVNMKQWNFKAIDVVNGHVRRRDEKLEAMREGIALLNSGHLVIEPLVTKYDLTKVEEAFRDLVNRVRGLYKIALVTQ